MQVVDTSNEGSSGAGWTIGPNGLPKLPINSVLIVLGVGGLVLEAASHAPVLAFFMPRVLQVDCLFGWEEMRGGSLQCVGGLLCLLRIRVGVQAASCTALNLATRSEVALPFAFLAAGRLVCSSRIFLG
jgi:hypothetical protein